MTDSSHTPLYALNNLKYISSYVTMSDLTVNN